MSNHAIIDDFSPWPHRWALLLCGTTFPLLWVGGLITTTDAGMAVPDWPNTYGYNMFAYPWQTWMFGPWDLFIEHGHRLLASLVGLLAIGLLVVVWRSDRRRWMRSLALAALALVIFQGVLGGLRVVANERLLAMAHGSTGPLFFALTCVIVVLTLRRPYGAGRPAAAAASDDGGLSRLALLTAALAYCQLVLGASLRHVDAATGPWAFGVLVKFHLFLAAVVAVQTLWVMVRTVRSRSPQRAVRVIGVLLGLVVTAQVGLGVATWAAKYGAPGWASDWLPATMMPIVAGGWSQTHTVTAHSANGSLLVGLLAGLTALAWPAEARQASPERSATSARPRPPRMENLPVS